jgi:hypothetical protein
MKLSRLGLRPSDNRLLQVCWSCRDSGCAAVGTRSAPARTIAAVLGHLATLVTNQGNVTFDQHASLV